MKNKFLFSTAILLISTILFMSLVSAVYVANGVQFNNPIASGIVTNTYMLNVTNVTGFNTIKNCTFYAKSSLTANSSWTIINGPTINNTLLKVNGTFNSAILEDANNYIFNATCRNLTNDITDVLITGVIISNTVPTTPSTLTPVTNTLLTTISTQTFSSTVVDRETTSCTYTISRGGATSGGDYFSGAGSYLADTCSFTKAFTTSADNGNWVWTVSASDEIASTQSSGVTLQVQIPGSGGGMPPVGEVTDYSESDCISNGCIWTGSACFCTDSQTTNNSMWWFGGIIFIIIVGIVIYYKS